jgi:hypothetical protein
MNLPVAAVAGSAFRSFLRETARLHELPSRAELRDGILRRASLARASVNPSAEGGEFVALMIDGAVGAHRTWLGVCLATFRRFHVWRLAALPDQKSATIHGCLVEIVTDLHRSRANARSFAKALECLRRYD